MMRVRFSANGNEVRIVDGEPGAGEATREQVEAWQELGVPLEILDDGDSVMTTEAVPPRRGRPPKGDR